MSDFFLKHTNTVINTLFVIFFVILLGTYFYQSDTAMHMFIHVSQKFLNKCSDFQQKDTVNIVMVTDSNYILPTGVCIYSAIKNKNKDSKYHFYILGVNLSENEKNKLSSLSDDSAKITIIPERNIYSFVKLDTINPHVPNSDFLKFNFPELFPNFKKILYIDGDIIVQGDLKSLYDINLSNLYAAAVEEEFIQFPLNNLLKISKYFNNGVILLNLEEMRKDDLTAKMLKYRFLKSPKRFVTQDTFNVVLYQKVKFIDSKYNVIIQDLDIKNTSGIDDYLKSAVIIHYAGLEKPWIYSDILYASQWLKYKQNLIKYTKNEFF